MVCQHLERYLLYMRQSDIKNWSRERTWALESGRTRSNPDIPPSICITSGLLLELSDPFLLHMLKGGEEYVCFMDVVEIK